MTRVELEKWFVTKDWEITKKDDKETILDKRQTQDEAYITDTDFSMGVNDTYIKTKLENIKLSSVSNLEFIGEVEVNS